ncbi:uncharacterized protein LOC131944826 isoform X2 [Physella acuta]|uniref:uncharacterized protein LOC131944826 isoform X2 n=1 Tax=Physella acuta TaxID=109671 RepID=UPI0027DE9A38|nr:uncharacterized protein LOC131944826 isoform X2 [Physella acuta]
MDSDLLTSVSSTELTLINNNVDENGAGLHVLSTDFGHGSEGMMGELSSDDCSRGVISLPALTSDMSNTMMEKDGEITLNSAFIPQNAVLLETPRGLMLTVPESMVNISYGDDSSPSDSSRPLLSCIPVSLFGTCDGSVDTVPEYGGEASNESQLNDENEELKYTTHLGGAVSSMEKDGLNQQLTVSEESTEMCVTTKKKGGWPKGKKRKIKPTFTGPRAPVTGYVLYALDRRKKIKETHPGITFSEVTKILGQEWSTMAQEIKDKYLAAAAEDKKRYRQELKAFRSSDTYQETVRKKLLLSDDDLSSIQESSDILNCDEEISNELYCKVCQVYFNNLHNKREHMYGKFHIQNVAGEVEKELLRQQREEQAFMDGALVVSEDMSQDEFSTALRSNATSSVSSNSSSSSTPPGPVDIHGFMMEFIHKNYEREQEISVLKKCLNKGLQYNVTMCKEIQELQDYQNKLEEEMKSLTTTTSALIVQSDALKMVPTLFGIINL